MNDELFDIVNEEDKIIGQATRKEVHRKGYIHRSVFFYLFDKQGKIFVSQRTANKEFYPEYWSIVFGGHLQAGETYENAVVREAKEEAGIEAEPVFITFFKKRLDEEDKENVKVYKLVTEQKPKLESNELKQGKFLTAEELGQKLKEDKFLPETDKLYQIFRRI